MTASAPRTATVRRSTAAEDVRRRQRVLVELGTFGRRVEASIADVVGDMELTGNAPVLLLCELALDGPLRPRELQALAGLTSGGMTKQLDRFEEMGLIQRTHGGVAGDRRAILVSLTPRGLDLATHLASVVDAHVDDTRHLLAQLATLIGEPSDASPPGS